MHGNSAHAVSLLPAPLVARYSRACVQQDGSHCWLHAREMASAGGRCLLKNLGTHEDHEQEPIRGGPRKQDCKSSTKKHTRNGKEGRTGTFNAAYTGKINKTSYPLPLVICRGGVDRWLPARSLMWSSPTTSSPLQRPLYWWIGDGSAPVGKSIKIQSIYLTLAPLV